MRKTFTASLVLAAVLVPVGVAQASLRSEAIHLRGRVVAQFGAKAPGRDIVHRGVWTGRRARPASRADLERYLGTLQRMLAPPPQSSVTTHASYAPPVSYPRLPSSSPVVNYAPSTSYVPARTASAGVGGVPACASESGTNYSTGPANTNPSSGATGRYQILPSTASAYGCSLGTAAGQDRCAAVIYAHQGAGAWVGCGG